MSKNLSGVLAEVGASGGWRKVEEQQVIVGMLLASLSSAQGDF